VLEKKGSNEKNTYQPLSTLGLEEGQVGLEEENV